MNKLKVMTVVGTRPEIIRLSACIKACDRFFDHVLVHTGQNWDYTLNEIFFRDLELRKPDHFLEAAGNSLGQTMGAILEKSYDVMQKETPDALLILGDTNSALAAISAKRLKIPVFHMEAGNRCFDENVPEEINRRIVDHISDINLPYTEHSRRYLLSEGIKKQHIFVTGSPMREVLSTYAGTIDGSDILERLELEAGRYFVLSAHREENIDNEKNFESLMNAINEIAETYGMPVIYSTHPRSRKRIEARGFAFHKLVRSLDPLGFHDYNKLQKSSFCVLSDSGTLSEESSILGFPAVLLRTSTERPEAIDRGRVIVGGITGTDVLRAVALAASLNECAGQKGSCVPDYEEDCVSEKVVRIIAGYTPIVNKVVWDKS